MSYNLVAFTERMDRCWLERRFEDLSAYIANDVVLVAPGGQPRIEGLSASVESYREFMSRCEISRFDARDYIVTDRGETAIIEYQWDMAWTDNGLAHQARGQEILVLSRGSQGWRVVWRTQLPVGGPAVRRDETDADTVGIVNDESVSSPTTRKTTT